MVMRQLRSTLIRSKIFQNKFTKINIISDRIKYFFTFEFLNPKTQTAIRNSFVAKPKITNLDRLFNINKLCYIIKN